MIYKYGQVYEPISDVRWPRHGVVNREPRTSSERSSTDCMHTLLFLASRLFVKFVCVAANDGCSKVQRIFFTLIILQAFLLFQELV